MPSKGGHTTATPPLRRIISIALIEDNRLVREGLTVLRLDLLPEAGDPAKFCDLVHLNRDGSESATRIVEAEIERILPR